MSGQWKPGDVAMAVCHDGEQVRAIMRHDGTWRLAESRWNLTPPREFRPLIVLDPESDRDVARVENALEARGRLVGTSVQAALRSLVAPPRPDEPTGLGAVVEDAEGDFWVYTGLRDDDDQRWFYHGVSREKYARIAAVRVLSEGIQ